MVHSIGRLAGVALALLADPFVSAVPTAAAPTVAAPTDVAVIYERALLADAAPTVAAPTDVAVIYERALLADAYAPTQTACPTTSLVRPATSLNSDEASYITSRKAKADTALASWLAQQGNFSTDSQPTVGFTSSGGGLRALLATAGTVQGFDGRDSNLSVSGLYQALTYQAGLSGGAWFLSSFAGNNWPTVSYLRDNLWEGAFADSLLLPANLLSLDDDTEYTTIIAELAAKQAAGYDTTIVDAYGRILSYQFFATDHGGVDIQLSDLTGYSNFTDHNVPYPIITAISVDDSYEGGCIPNFNNTQFEFHPYEYGSWDTGVSAFASTKYMGTELIDGVANGTCTLGYDNLGYIFGTSSDVFFYACEILEPIESASADLENVLEAVVNKTHDPEFQDLFGIYPNPFYAYPRSTNVSDQSLLTLIDGGVTDQNNPIWPFLQPERDVDVLIVNDNSADTDDNFPNGTEILQTYQNAQYVGLTKMPYIPSVSTIVGEGLNKRATFFGCNETDTMLIVWLPNVAYTFDSGTSTEKVQYSVAETDAMIANGNLVASQNGTAGWSFCLACAVKLGDRKGSLPSGCDKCFEEYCYCS